MWGWGEPGNKANRAMQLVDSQQHVSHYWDGRAVGDSESHVGLAPRLRL